MAVYSKIAVSNVTYWVDRPYDYLVPDSMADRIKPGMRVCVPFSRGNRRSEGIVLSVTDKCDYSTPKAIMDILDDEPVLTKSQLDLALWMRERYFCTVYEAVRAILPAGLWFDASGKRKSNDKTVDCAVLAVSGEEAMAEAQRLRMSAKKQAAVLELLAAVGEGSIAEIKVMTDAGRNIVNALRDKGLVTIEKREVFRKPEFRHGKSAPLPELTAEQKTVFDGIAPKLDSKKAGCSLIFGVTGSGKTSVYVHLIENTLRQGRTAMLLVPEIALTPQMLQTFSSYFGEKIAVMHSSLSMGERYDEWKRAKSGDATLIIGTRSAVFAPCENLGLIIIDEEQEQTYKSENAPRYHARDIAKYRCFENGAQLVLGSATPDIESRYSAESGRYSYFTMTQRYNRMALPEVKIVDMKRELRGGNSTSISSFLREELQKNIEAGQQSILFLNRRGASKLITCVDCGYNFKCPNCSVSLTYHSYGNRLTCHYCGYSRTVASVCPDCGGELNFIGDGTQKIEEQLGEIFPGVPVMRVDTDTVTAAGGHQILFDRFREENIPIMVGTQMVTKGLNFENVTLVGVISADQSLYSGDYRSYERTFSLITQVVGRSGRAQTPGRAIIQTFTPENPVIRYAARQDYEAFFREEIELRRIQKCPPFTQLVTISAAGGDERTVLSCCMYIKGLLEHELGKRPGQNILGPAPYNIVRVNRQFRYKITLACTPDREIRALVSKILIYCNTENKFRGVSVYADVNPVD